MKIQNRKDTQVMLTATFRQPYPVCINKFSMDNNDFDLAIQTSEVSLLIDGVEYIGGVYYLLDKVLDE